MEVWLDIAGFEGLYQVSNKGNFKGLTKSVSDYRGSKILKERPLKPWLSSRGLLQIRLHKDGKPYDFMVARLVYETFTKTKLKKEELIAYKDEDKRNVSFNNLYKINRKELSQQIPNIGMPQIKKHEYYGDVLSMTELSERSGIDVNVISHRVNRYKWNVYEASETPVAVRRKG